MKRYRDFDWLLLCLVLLMSVISVCEIYSATLHTKFHGYHTRQVGFLLAGLAVLFLVSMVDYHRLIGWAPWAYGVGVVSLLAVLVAGQKVLGARRWIRLPGGIHFQPSEWVKLVLIVMMARFLWSLRGRELDWREIGKSFALVGIPMLMVLNSGL